MNYEQIRKMDNYFGESQLIEFFPRNSPGVEGQNLGICKPRDLAFLDSLYLLHFCKSLSAWRSLFLKSPTDFSRTKRNQEKDLAWIQSKY